MTMLGLSLSLWSAAVNGGGGVPPSALGYRVTTDGDYRVDADGDRRKALYVNDDGTQLVRQIAARQGIRFGTAIQSDTRLAKPGPGGVGTLADFLRDNADLYVPGIHMLPQTVEAVSGVFDTSQFESFLSRVATDGKRWRGHVLLYPAKDTSSVTSALTPANWQAKMTARFEALASVPGSQTCENMDVVNELMDAAETATNGYRPNAWYTAAGGPAYIVYAFQEARRLWPTTPLYWCHDHVEQLTDTYHQNQAAYMLTALEAAMNAGAPIDGFNMQAHLTIRLGFDPVRLRTFCADLQSLGLDLMIGELDVRTGYKAGSQEDTRQPSQYSIAEYDRVEADLTKKFLDIALPFVKTGGREFLCWGLSDIDNSWEDPPNPSGERPLPYDTNYAAKPMLSSIRNALLEL